MPHSQKLPHPVASDYRALRRGGLAHVLLRRGRRPHAARLHRARLLAASRCRDNGTYAIAINGWRGGSAPAVVPPASELPLHNARFERNTTHGDFKAIAVNCLTMDANQFHTTPP